MEGSACNREGWHAPSYLGLTKNWGTRVPPVQVMPLLSGSFHREDEDLYREFFKHFHNAFWSQGKGRESQDSLGSGFQETTE